MPKTMDAAVREMLGGQLMTIAALQVQIDELQEQLAEAKKPVEKKPSDLHEVGKR